MTKTKKPYYVTTAIDYVNARPHVGHAYEKVLADALVRWHRVLGEKTRFLTGTDENAQKNEQAAKAAGVAVAEFVKKNSDVFLELCKKLNIAFDRFIRTTDADHVKLVQEIFRKMYDKGDIYKGKYEGLYCIGCECFVTERDLVNGKCPEHDRAPIKMSEEAYFFKLSKYEGQILKFIRDYIIPEDKKNEILARLNEEELKDLCVSRTNLSWGIDSPIDKKFKIYVWLDALSNYLTGADNAWPADLHIIGKGINWFHSVIWPGILMSAEYELPKKLLVHSYLNFGGEKMSKSKGNIIDPLLLIDKYGADVVRYSLLRCSVFNDSDYSEEILMLRNNNELADKLGNLVSRVAALAEKYGLEKCELKKLPDEVKNRLLEGKAEILGGMEASRFNNEKIIGGSHVSIIYLKEEGHYMSYSPGLDLNPIKEAIIYDVTKKMEDYEIDKALKSIFLLIDYCNWYVQENALWKSGDKKKLYELADSIKAIGILLWPFIPASCEKIGAQFGFKVGEGSIKEISKPLKVGKIKKGEILFRKIE